MKMDLWDWMRANLLFDGEGGAGGSGEGEPGGGGGGPAGEGDPGAGEAGAGNGAPEPTWRDTYLKDTEFYEDQSLATIPDVPTLAKSFVNARKKIGEKGIIPPKPEASAEEWAEFFAAVPRPADDAAPEVKAAYQKFLGSPDVPTVYDEAIVMPEDFPAEFVQEGLLDDFKKAAFEAGVPLAHAKAMFDWYMGKSKESLGSMPPIKEIAPGVFVNDTIFLQNRDQVQAALKTELGDTYDATLARVQAAVTRFGGKELVQYYEETGLGNHPATIKAWMNVVNAMSEDGTLHHGAAGGGEADLQAQLDLISTNPALLDRNHPDHTKIVKQRDALFAKLHPDEPKE